MKKKIKKRILTYFVCLTLSGITLATATGIYYSRKASLNKHFESSKVLAKEVLHNVNQIYEIASQNVKVISENSSVKLSINSPGELLSELKKLKNILGTYDDITILTPKGEVMVSTDYNYSTGWKFRDFFKKTVRDKKTFVSNAYFLPDPLRYITTFTAPILDNNDRVIAVVAAQLNMKLIESIVQHVELNKTGFAYLVSNNKLYLSHPNRDKILEQVPESEWAQLSTGSKKFSYKTATATFIGNFYKENGNTVVVVQAKDEVLNEFYYIIRSIIVISSCIAIFALFLGLKFSRSLTTPIEQLNETIHKFTEGDNSARARVSTQDEIGELAKDFNTMVEEVNIFRNQLEKLVKERTEELEKAKNETESANKAKSSFLANMSHEIRTPMNAILGFSQILHRMESDEEKKYFLSSIMTGGKTLLSIINDILDVSKIESGKFILMLSQVSLKSLFHDTCTILKNEARKKSLDLSYDIAEDFPPFIIADENRLRQVLINLVGNAIKFTDQGSIKLETEWQYADELKKFISLKIRVIDTGIGISENEHEEIFQDFVQSKNQGDRLYQGTGLGLSICNKLINLMNGSLQVKSSLNQGSTFEITLPKVEVSENKLIQKNFLNNLSYEFVNFEESKVLVVDDNKSNLEFLTKVMENRNVNMTFAENGEDAIKVAQEFKPDLILMDLKMPRLNGYQAAEAIKSHAATKGIPIIAISASIVEENKSSFKNLFVSFIPKPVNSDLLLSELMKYLNHSYMNHEKSNKVK